MYYSLPVAAKWSVKVDFLAKPHKIGYVVFLPYYSQVTVSTVKH